MIGYVNPKATTADFKPGDRVTYHSYTSNEQGWVSSVGADYVFVRYDGDSGAKATDPRYLTHAAIKKEESI